MRTAMNSPGEILRKAIADSRASLDAMAQLEPEIVRGADAVTSCLTAGGKLLVCGNGGSAADAADFTTEFACRFADDRRCVDGVRQVGLVLSHAEHFKNAIHRGQGPLQF